VEARLTWCCSFGKTLGCGTIATGLVVSDWKTARDFRGETNCTRCKLVGGFVVLDTVCVKELSLTRPPCGGSTSSRAV
jgi:hypothetical protein